VVKFMATVIGRKRSPPQLVVCLRHAPHEPVAHAALSPEDARALTEEVKADAGARWAKLLRLYEGAAHIALGYDSWGDYYEEEFEQSGRRGEQLLRSARVMRALEPANHGSLPTNERVARELDRVLRDDPEQVAKVWGEVVDQHGPKPTAAQVRELVRERVEPAAKPGRPVKPAGKRALRQHRELVQTIAWEVGRLPDTLRYMDLAVVEQLSDDTVEQQLTDEQRDDMITMLRDGRTAITRLLGALSRAELT
jgi:hypothetical protein